MQRFQPENNANTVGALTHYNDHPSLRALRMQGVAISQSFRQGSLNKTPVITKPCECKAVVIS
ncbi:MAG: hypothetical protein IKN18_02585, partial [Neisseriaceae bacterium]|nr:hypothetical protein [Neisseriaceae bacterium]